MIELRTLAKTTKAELLVCFNEAFSDYMIPMKLTAEQLESKLIIEDIKFADSIGAFKHNKLIGFVIHGVRETNEGKLAYNAGTGVIPTERGQGLTVRMYDYMLPRFKSEGFNKVMLEVISNNLPAIRSYEKIGFTSIRTLNCYRGEIKSQKTNPEVSIKHIENWNSETVNLKWEVKPSWQNSDQSIKNLAVTAHCLVAYIRGDPIGHALINSSNNRVLQIKVDKNYRKERVGSSIMNYIKSNYSDSSSIINVDSAHQAINSFIENIGMTNFLQQIEMKLSLAT